MPKDTIHAKGVEIGIYTDDFQNEFISLTDIARYQNIDDPRFVIRNWMRSRDTIEFLGIWEELHNPEFKRAEFGTFREEAGTHRFVISPEKWISRTSAKGMINQLLVLANIESYNAILIGRGKSQSERLVLLREMVKVQLKSLSENRDGLMEI